MKCLWIVQQVVSALLPPAVARASGRDLTRKGSSVGPSAQPVTRAEPAGELRPAASAAKTADIGHAAGRAADARQSRAGPAGSQQGRSQLPSPPRPPRPQLSAGDSFSGGGAGTAVSPPAGFRSLLTGSAGGHGRLSLAASGTSTLGGKARDLPRPAVMLLSAEAAAGFRKGFVVPPIGHSVALPFELLKPGAPAALSCTPPAAAFLASGFYCALSDVWALSRTPLQHPDVNNVLCVLKSSEDPHRWLQPS